MDEVLINMECGILMRLGALLENIRFLKAEIINSFFIKEGK
jgi:hypothetical protein